MGKPDEPMVPPPITGVKRQSEESGSSKKSKGKEVITQTRPKKSAQEDYEQRLEDFNIGTKLLKSAGAAIAMHKLHQASDFALKKTGEGLSTGYNLGKTHGPIYAKKGFSFLKKHVPNLASAGFNIVKKHPHAAAGALAAGALLYHLRNKNKHSKHPSENKKKGIKKVKYVYR